MVDEPTVDISRLTAATATDLLYEYETELRETGAEGEYTREIGETAAALEAALGDDGG